jgi:hypothetical protein
MTGEQKAALDLAILNLRTHGDDQLLSAVQPLIEFYESRVLAERKEPVAWVRYRSDGGFEGPIMDSDARMCDTRRSFWTPLFAHPTPDDAKDAARYRFIKSKVKTFSLDMGGNHTYVMDYSIARVRGPSLDAAIDRARQSGEEGK